MAASLTVFEFFRQVICIRRFRAQQLTWDISTGSFAEHDKPGRRAVTTRIESLATAGQVRRNALDVVPGNTRILMLGSQLKRHGDRWAAAHPAYMDWLASQGVTREEAIRRHEEWHAEEMRHPFWSNLKL